MFNFKKKEPKIDAKIQEVHKELKNDINELKLQAVMQKVAEQEIIIRRLLELVIMNIEHKDYSKFLLPKITQVKNILDKK